MTDQPLANELRVFEEHKGTLLATAEGGYALIHGDEIVGTYTSERDALDEGYRRFGRGPFLVKEVVANETPILFTSSLITH